MTITAKLAELDYADGVGNVLITYTDGVSLKVSRRHRSASLNNAAIAAFARADAAELANAAVSVSKVTLAIGDVIDLTPPAVVAVTPSAADITQAQFFTDYAQYQRYQRAINAGLLDAADKRATDLAAKLKAEWLDSYLGMI